MSRFSRRPPIARLKAAKKAAKMQPDELIAAVGAVRLVGSPAVIEAADNLVTALVKDEEAQGQALLDVMTRVVKSPEEGVTDEEVATLEEELDAMERPSPVHLSLARAAFEEAARRDLGQGPSGRSTAKQGTA
jgi:hypothetical protein